MKTRLLAGLTALVLGAFTSSCSNILEENGVINNVAESGMGELRINLSTDASLNVSTKADVGITLNDEEKKKFVISGTMGSSSVSLGTFEEYVGEKTKTVAAGDYSSITATYTSMGEGVVLNFNTPEFEGSTESSVKVEANKQVDAAITAKLTNSIITVNSSAFDKLKETANITELFVYSGDTEPTTTTGKFSLLSESNTLDTTKKLYVKSGKSNIHIVLKGTLNNDNSKAFSASANIIETGKTGTEPAKKYEVSYEFSDKNGSLGLDITVDGTVTPVIIKVEPINPYKSATE